MQVYQAFQLKETGKWHYCCSYSAGIYPLGYCADRNCQHETSKEAEACYRTYQLDNELRLNEIDESKQLRCQVCGAWTQNRAILGLAWPNYYTLCEEHCTRENVEKLATKNI